MSRRSRSFFQNTTRSLPRHHMTTETIVGGNIIATDGSVGKMVRLGGLKTMKALSDYDGFINNLSRQATSALNAPGHAIQVYFARDPSFARLWAQDLVRPMKAAASFFGLDMERHIKIREDLLASRVIPEVAYIVFWTRPSALDPRELKVLEQDVQHPPAWPGAENAQNVWGFFDKLVTVHNAWTRDLVETFTRRGITISNMSNDEVITAMRASIHPSKAGMPVPTWMPGDTLPPGAKPQMQRGDMPATSTSPNDLSGNLWPRLHDTIFDGADANILSADRVRVGNTIWASYEMSRGPLDQQPFSALLSRVRQDDEIPWRVSFTLTTDTLPQVTLKAALARLTGITSDSSKLLNQALLAARDDATVGRRPVGVQVIFSTWASTAEEANRRGTIDIRASRLQRSIEGWGGCLIGSGGDPLALTLGAGLGINPASPAARGVVPHHAALRFLPFDRTSSPLAEGSLTFLTDSDTPYPWEIGTSIQNSAADFFSGMPGQGKSNLASTMILGYVLSRSTVAKMTDRSLPFLGVADIGFSQKGTIETLRAALPPSRIEEAQYHHLLNTVDFAINVLDTQPGLRHPISIERTFLINFLTELITPVGAPKPPERLAELCGAVIDQVYRETSDIPSDQGRPKIYTRGYDREVDNLIAKYGLSPTEGLTTWWDVVDGLHSMGTPDATNAAILAQRNAVPRLDDLSKVLVDSAIESVWGAARNGATGERLIDMFRLSLTSVTTEYKILSSTTRFSLGAGRVVVLDLGGIVGGEGPAAAKMSSIMFMLARSILTRGYYLTDDMLSNAPANWAEWHTRRVRLYREAPKRLIMDEFHKTKNSRGVRDQLITDIREGRKWGVSIQILSQMISDFDQEALELATSVYILGVGNAASKERIRSLYDISAAAVERLENRLTGPTSRGAPMLALHVTKSGRTESFLYNVKSAYELWADSTSQGATSIRERVAGHLGFTEACMELALRFPSGDSKSEEDRLQKLDPNTNVIAMIADDVIQNAKSRRAA